MYRYVVNPAAGRGAIQSVQAKLQDRLAAIGIDGEFMKTTGPGDGVKLARLAVQQGATTVVAVGGDDTVNEVINGLGASNTVMGIIPIGSTNRLASHIGIGHWEQACDILATRRVAAFSLIAAGQKFFLSTLSIGFGATPVIEETEAAPPKRLDRLRASLAAPSSELFDCHLLLDDRLSVAGKLHGLTVSNQKFLDPALENRLVVSFTNQAPPQSLFKRLGRKWRDSDEASSRFLAKRLILETKPPTDIVIDGKNVGKTPIAIRLTNRQVRLICAKLADSTESDPK